MSSFIKKLLLLIICLIFLIIDSLATSYITHEAQSQPLAQRLEKLADLLEQNRLQYHIPGMAMAIVKNGEIIMCRGFGEADRENGKPVTSHTLFGIGSATKSFTAALIAMLADDGKMTWDDPITKFLPYFKLKLKNSEPDAQVTIRDLLAHRTGFGYMTQLCLNNQVNRSAILHQAMHAEALGAFRTEFKYSNVMYLAAGMAAAKAAHSDWDRLIQKRIFQPLHMERSTTSFKHTAKGVDRARGYTWDEELARFKQTPLLDIDNCAPAGSICSCASDMANWLCFQLAHGQFSGQTLLREENHNACWTKQIAMEDNLAYGFGWMIGQWRDQRLIYHGGNTYGASAQVALLPDAGVGFVLLANVLYSPLLDLSKDLVWDAVLASANKAAAAPPATLAPEQLQKYLGSYDGDKIKETVQIVMKNNCLALQIPGQMAYELRLPDQAGKWLLQMTDSIAIRFEEAPNGQVTSFCYYENGGQLKYIRASPANASAVPDLTAVLALRQAAKRLSSLQRLQTIQLSGTIRLPNTGLAGKVRWTFAGTDNMIQANDFGIFGTYRITTTATGAWSALPNGRVDELHGRFHQQQLLNHPAAILGDWRIRYCAINVLNQMEQNGKAVTTLELHATGLPATVVTIDTQTGDTLEETRNVINPEVAHMQTPVKFTYTDYRDIGGLRIPFTITSESPQTGKTIVHFKTVRTGTPWNAHRHIRASTH